MKKIVFAIGLVIVLQYTTKAQEVVVIKKSIKDTTQPLVVIDGVISEQAKVNDISPNDIKSINVLKGANAKDKYGVKGENGVIEITSKKKAKAGKLDSTENMTVVINGDQVTINGVPADKNDPRIVRRGKVTVVGGKNGQTITVKGDTITKEDIEIEELADEPDDLLAPPPPPLPMNAAFLGVMTKAAEDNKGAVINTVSEASPAEKAGLKANDIITKLNDKVIDGPKSLYDAVGTYKVDEKVNITYLRDGKEKKTTAVLTKNKAAENQNTFTFKTPNGDSQIFRKGFRIRPDQNFSFEMPEIPGLDGLSGRLDGLTGRFNKKPKLGISIEDLESGVGVKVKAVTEASPAEKAGFKVGDIIIQLDDNKVSDVNDLKWEYIQDGQTLKFTVQRGADKKTIEVKIPKKLKTADL